MERMMAAAIDAQTPQEFDRVVNGDPEMQITLLRWRGHLTLAARAFYRTTVQACDAATAPEGSPAGMTYFDK